VLTLMLLLNPIIYKQILVYLFSKSVLFGYARVEMKDFS